MTMRRNAARGVAIALALAGLLGGSAGRGPGHDRHHRRDRSRTSRAPPCPGATVTITEVNKGTGRTYTTDADGSFVAPFLIPGTYEVAVELTGFRKYTHRGVVLQVNQRARVDATLEVGGLTEATEVVGLAPLTRTDSAELGEVIEERAVRELPLNGRNFAPLVYLVPGVTARPGRREPLRRLHLQPARRLELQRARLAGQHQRLAGRRHRQQRVHLQHRDRAADGRVGARVQGADRHLLRRVRPRRRRRLRLDQVGQQRVARHRLRVPAQREVRRQELLRAAHGAQGARSTATSSAPRCRARSSRTRPSSSWTTPASRRSAARCS